MPISLPRSIRSNTLIALLAWSAVVALSLGWNLYQVHQQSLQIARHEADAYISKNIIIRQWVASHGGVYVTPSERTPPNPYLAHIPDRDVKTTDGKALTLMNPAYVLRELLEYFPGPFGEKEKAISLKPLNPGSQADDQERKALLRLEHGEKEVLEIQEVGGETYLHLMRPFLVEESCLKCHGHQDYKVGDVRGGMKVLIPLAAFRSTEDVIRQSLALGHGFIWLLGLAGIGLFSRRAVLHQSETHWAMQTLAASERRFRSLTNLGAEWYWEYDENCRFVDISGGERFLQTIPANVDPIGKTTWELGYVAMEDAIWQQHRQLLQEHQPFRNFEINRLGRDGSVYTVCLSGEPIFDEAGRFAGYRGIGSDITKSKAAEDLIWKQANFDPLTGLPNRRMFHDRLRHEVKKVQRAGLQLAVLFIDIDNFKEVNDTLGHPMGDILLIEAARRIADCVRETDTVARLGGDEFTVLLNEIDDVGSIERVSSSILKRLAEPFSLGSNSVLSSASIGITLYPNDTTAIDDLLKNADQAMYVAKNQGRNRYSYFTPALQQAAQERLHLINDLRGAVAAEQLRVYFQPIVDLSNGQIHKAEALVRWQHPQRGMVSPAAFIPLAEEIGLIFEIGDWVFKEAARWSKHWRSSHHPEFQVSVNKSPAQFFRHNAYENWFAHMRQLELPGQGIVIEITEGLLLKSDAPIMEALLAYRDMGIQVAIDDFGTGYSSLSYLNKFDIDYLKVDQSFTRNLAPGSSDMVLTEAIIMMAHKLGLKVIAEGVETEEQRALLLAAGCDYGQGYLFARPMPPEQFEVLLARR